LVCSKRFKYWKPAIVLKIATECLAFRVQTVFAVAAVFHA